MDGDLGGRSPGERRSDRLRGLSPEARELLGRLREERRGSGRGAPRPLAAGTRIGRRRRLRPDVEPGFWRSVGMFLNPFGARSLARELARARRQEPTVSAQLEGLAAAQGVHLLPSENRIKPAASAARKVAWLARKAQLPQPQAVALLNDPLRYTVVAPPERYTEAVAGVLRGLAGLGYRIDTGAVRNYWGNPDNFYRGINANLRTPDGLPVEVQFHTPQSLHLNDSTHDLYEEWRTPETSESRRAELYELIRHRYLTAETPLGVEALGVPVGYRASPPPAPPTP